MNAVILYRVSEDISSRTKSKHSLHNYTGYQAVVFETRNQWKNIEPGIGQHPTWTRNKYSYIVPNKAKTYGTLDMEVHIISEIFDESTSCIIAIGK